MPANEMCSPSSTNAAAWSAVPVKDEGPPHWAELLELLDDVGLAVAAMNDYGKPAFMCQGQVTAKPFLLIGKRRSVPVAIQPGFTDRHDPGFCRQFDDARPVARFSLGDMIGLNPDRGKNASMIARDLDDGGAILRPWCRLRRSGPIRQTGPAQARP